MPVPTLAVAPQPQRPLRLPAALVSALIGALISACATAPSTEPPVTALLHDTLFQPVSERVDAAAVFALTDAMRRFADTEIAGPGRRQDARRLLINALAARDHLQLAYDDDRTRNAAEAFDQRAGNCLSLVIMTSAFAKYLDIPVRYQSVQVQPQYSRNEDLTLISGHVNVVLSRHRVPALYEAGTDADLLVDFVAPSALRGRRVHALAENTVLAMYMNNRAAEALTAGGNDAAYAWAREALRQDAAYLPGINTLALVYLRSGHLAPAEAALRHVLAREPDDEAALSNLVVTLRRAGRTAEAQQVAAHLAAIEPYPPFHFLDLGRQALQEGRADQARELIARELRRQPYQHEVLFWAAVVDARLGDTDGAEKHLRLAIENGDSPQQQARYSAKLAALRAPVAH